MPLYRRRSAPVTAVQWRGDNLAEFAGAFGEEFATPPCLLWHWLVKCGNQQAVVFSPGEFERAFEVAK